jgi:hypothetical protein
MAKPALSECPANTAGLPPIDAIARFTTRTTAAIGETREVDLAVAVDAPEHRFSVMPAASSQARSERTGQTSAEELNGTGTTRPRPC